MDPRSNIAEVHRAAGAGGVAGIAPPTHSYALSGKIMLSAIVILFSIVLFILFLHLYVRWNVLRRASRRTQRRHRLIFTGEGHQLPTSAVNHALDPTVLKSLPMLLFSSSADEEEELVEECAVCLDKFEEGEKIRFLPRCGHRFHIDCIDMWFSSHSNCPLCRAAVEIAAALPAADSSPSSVLSATEEEGEAGSLSSLGSTAGEVAIVVPVGRIEGFSGQEEQLGLWLGSPALKWPSSRIVLLRWLLTRDNRPSRVGVEEMEPDLERGEVLAPPL